MEKLSYKNVTNWDNQRLWGELDLVTYVELAWNLGYRYALWHDDRVYTMIQNKTGKWIVEQTDYTRDDIE